MHLLKNLSSESYVRKYDLLMANISRRSNRNSIWHSIQYISDKFWCQNEHIKLYNYAVSTYNPIII